MPIPLFTVASTSELVPIHHMTYAMNLISRHMILDSLHFADCSPSCLCLWHSLWLAWETARLGALDVWLKRAVIGWHGPSVARGCGANIRDACPSLAIAICGVEILNLFEELGALLLLQHIQIPEDSSAKLQKMSKG